MVTYKGTKIPTSYATCSIGHDPTHNLPAKLEAISKAGFEAIELSMPDILDYGSEIKNTQVDPKDYDTLVEIGLQIKKLTDAHNLKVLMLQPFANFEGWPAGSKERIDAFQRADGWIRIMKAVGTDMLQIGSSDSPGITPDTDIQAADLAELADKMAKQGLRIAYENWCWATHAPHWHDVWTIVSKANRPNIGLCLDTFQSAGGEWADPTSHSGLREDIPRHAVQEGWEASLRSLASTVPAEKIFLLQISDAYRMSPALRDEEDGSGLRPRGQWSHDHRPLPFDGGYLPIVDFLSAVLETGFRGWLSVEVFDGKAGEKYPDMARHADMAMDSLQRLLQEAGEKQI